MKKTPIRKGQIYEDTRTGRRGEIYAYNGQRGWTIVWARGGGTASRHLREQVIWKFYRLVEPEERNVQ
jgi:hypothetical protein